MPVFQSCQNFAVNIRAQALQKVSCHNVSALIDRDFNDDVTLKAGKFISNVSSRVVPDRGNPIRKTGAARERSGITADQPAA